MKASRKDRRGERVPGTHRLLLTIHGPTGAEILKEVVTTVELSQHGARLRGLRTMQPGAQGFLTQLKSGRQAPFRVAWQAKAASDQRFMDTGVELLAGFDFWEITFTTSQPGPDPVEIQIETKDLSPQELLEELRKWSALSEEQRNHALEAAWCGLIEQLESRKVLTRSDLVASLRSIAQQAQIGRAHV